MIDLFLDNLLLILRADGDGRRVRDALLRLAVRGRLVGQDAREEPFAPHNAQRDDRCLPIGWARVRFDQLGDHRLGKMLDKGSNAGEERPYLRNVNVRWMGFDLSDLKTMRVEDAELAAVSATVGDLLICEGGEPGRCAVWRDPSRTMVIQKALHRLRPHRSVLPDFVAIALRVEFDSGRLAAAYTGATIKHLTGQSLRQYQLAMPPTAEQHRIVAKADELTEQAAALEQRHLAAATARVRLRDAALHALAEAEDAAAVEQAWQRIEEHFEDLFTEPEDVAPLRQAIVDCMMGSGLASACGGLVRKPLGAVLDGIDAGRSPQCLDRPRVGREWGILKVSACTGRRFRPEENKCAPPNFQVDQSHEVCVGDILMARCSGNVDLVGRTVMVEQVDPHLALCDKTLRLRPSADLEPRYLLHLLQTSGVRAALVSGAAGGGGLMRNISQKQLREVPLEIAPSESQHRIVAKVDELMALCDTLEASLNRAKAGRERFAASISAALDADPTQSPDRDAA